MKHLTSFNQIFEANYKTEYIATDNGFDLLNNLMKTFKERCVLIENLAKKHNYTLIKNFVQVKREWEIIMVFESNLEPNEDIRRKQWANFSDDHNDLLPTVDPFSERRFISQTYIQHWNIKEWEKSKKLNKVNQKSGVFENQSVFLEKNLTIKIYLDWS